MALFDTDVLIHHIRGYEDARQPHASLSFFHRMWLIFAFHWLHLFQFLIALNPRAFIQIFPMNRHNPFTYT